jgi:hypothetical protein
MGARPTKLFLKGCLQNPATSIVAFAILVALLAIISRQWSQVPQAWPGVTVLAIADKGAFTITDPDNESWDEAARLLRSTPDDVALLTYCPQRRLGGWLAPTREIVEKKVEFDESRIARDRPPGSRDRARAAFVEWLGASRRPYTSDSREIAAGDVHRVTILPSGYLLNISVAAAFALLLYSMLWLQRIPGWLAERHRRRSVARGACPSCGYSIGGLPSTVCPECGKPWESGAMTQVTG